MNYKNFNSVVGKHGGYWDLYDLAVGDYFMEDTYPEVFQVKEIVIEDVSGEGQMETVVKSWNVTDNVDCDWFYARQHSAYSPCLVKLEPLAENEE